jgi:hypothetical protein
MTNHRTFASIALLLTIAVAGLGAQAARPANVPIHTWVREDMFAGFLDDDFVRFETGEKKVMEYLAETPDRPEALAWMVGGKLYRASRAFRENKAADGDRLVQDAMAMMDTATGRAPDNVGVHATLGGSVVLLANRLPERYYLPLMERARTHFAKLYSIQSRALPQLPLHIKGELLAGVAETEFRTGNRAGATETLQLIVKEMPGTPYARNAEAWLAAPEKVTRDTKIVCQSCHEPGRLAAWQARQQPGAQ